MHGAVALGLVEQVAHAAGADADEHLDELGAGDAEERARRPRRRRRGPAASCRCRAGPPAARRAGCGAPSELNFSGYLRNSTTSCSSVLASSTPATSLKVTTVLLPRNIRARLLPKLIAWLLVPWAWRIMNHRNTPMSRMGKSIEMQQAEEGVAVVGWLALEDGAAATGRWRCRRRPVDVRLDGGGELRRHEGLDDDARRRVVPCVCQRDLELLAAREDGIRPRRPRRGRGTPSPSPL